MCIPEDGIPEDGSLPGSVGLETEVLKTRGLGSYSIVIRFALGADMFRVSWTGPPLFKF